MNTQLVVGSYQKLVIKSPFPSINDASWYQFRKLEYFGVKFGKVTVA
ncbi:transposase, partial [Limnospira fusiformis CCALA 023]